MEITSENGHLAQRNTIKDIKGVTSASIMTVVEKTEKKWEEIWRGATSAWSGGSVFWMPLKWVDKKMHAHARAKASIHTYTKGKKKIKIWCSTAASTGCQQLWSQWNGSLWPLSVEVVTEWESCEHREPVCCSLANLWTFVESAGCCMRSLQLWIRFTGKRKACICVCIIAWLR